MELIEAMTPDEVEKMKKIYSGAKANINAAVKELQSLAFEYENLLIVRRFEQAEVIMAKYSLMSIAVGAWREVRELTKEFETPFEAMAQGIIELEDKYQNAAEVDRG